MAGRLATAPGGGGIRWQRFPFFDKQVVARAVPGAGGQGQPQDARDSKPEPSSDLDVGPEGLFTDFTPSVCSAGRSFIVLGGTDGSVRALNQDFQIMDWSAYATTVNHLVMGQFSSVLVSVGYDQPQSLDAIVKFWQLDRVNAANVPFLAHEFRLFDKLKRVDPAPVSCIAVLEDRSQMVVGLGSGAVLLIQGELQKPRGSLTRSVLRQSGPCVTHLAFCKKKDRTAVYICDNASVASLETSPAAAASSAVACDLDSYGGADLNCAVLQENNLVAARKEGVFFYEPEDRLSVYALEGDKLFARWFKSYLILVTRARSPSPTIQRSSLLIIDVKNHFIANRDLQRFDNVVDILVAWGAVFVVCQDRLVQLSEKERQTKLDHLFRRHWFATALSLAKSEGFSDEEIAEMHKIYGDYLYGTKRPPDYNAAIEQYVHSIPHVEPSYVIRKFLDAQRIQNLTMYLQALHDRGAANSDHTTLLLNCYTKLKDSKRLDEFIKGRTADKFDVDTAIRVCRNAGYFRHALYLARRHARHEQELQVLVDDLHQFGEAIVFMASLPELEAARSALAQYGKKLMAQRPNETTQLLMELCTGYVPRPRLSQQQTAGAERQTGNGGGGPPAKEDGAGLQQQQQQPPPGTRGSAGKASAEDFIHLFVGRPVHLRLFLEFIVETTATSHQSETIWTTLLELCLRQFANPRLRQMGRPQNSRSSAADDDGDGLPAPTQARAVNTAADETDQQLLSQQPAQPLAAAQQLGEEPVLADLDDPNSRAAAAALAADVTETEASLSKRVMEILRSQQAEYDPGYAMMLTKQFGFEQGLIFLFEGSSMFQEVVHHHMDRGNRDAVLACCQQYNAQMPDVWVQALHFFARIPGSPNEQRDKDLRHVLEAVFGNALLPPLMIIQILGANADIPLGVVRDLLVMQLQGETRIIDSQETAIKQMQKETTTMRKDMETLKTQSRVFQDTACAQCNAELAFPPMVRFLCKHSYHKSCLDDEIECPLCADERKRVDQMISQMKGGASDHDKFYKRLESAPAGHGFETLSGYFSRGVIS